MGSVRALVVVKGDPAPDADPSLRSRFPGVQIDAFILQGSPQPLDEDVVETGPLPSIEMRVPIRFSRSVQAKDVNCDP